MMKKASQLTSQVLLAISYVIVPKLIDGQVTLPPLPVRQRRTRWSFLLFFLSFGRLAGRFSHLLHVVVLPGAGL